MSSRYEHYWMPASVPIRFGSALAISIALHVMAALVIFYVVFVYQASLPQTFRVQFIPYPKGEAQKQEIPENLERGLGEGAKPA
ncbi:MAG TPA: hypothetical protein PKO36_17045, partial [Candidatus Hydrogenedentes bacterium]|nr:hypothetical protein [Candidatus Hydrogenedentota bacterium]